MTPLNFAIVGLRLLAIYLFFQAGVTLAYAPFFLEISNQIPGLSQIGPPLALFPSGSLLLLATLLFIFAPSLARHLAPPVADESKKTACSFEDLQSIVFAAVGILILSNALPSVGRALQNLYAWYSDQQQGIVTPPNQVRDSLIYYVGVLAQITIGLLLLINPSGFRKIWHWLRTAGTRPVE
jgi:hypothetical protein